MKSRQLLALLALSIAAIGLPHLGPAVTVNPVPPDPDDFDGLLHGAAFSYAEGNMLAASNSVHRALALQPGHPQAEALRKLIEETPPEQQQQEDQQQEEDQQDSEDQRQEGSDEEQPQAQPAPDESEQQPPEEQPSEERQQQETSAETEPAEPAQLTPEEARMLLDSLRQLDKVFPMRPPQMGRMPAVRRDW